MRGELYNSFVSIGENFQPFLPPVVYEKGREILFNRRYRHKTGEVWNELGQLQVEFLKEQGLQPDDRLLDVGCGAMRGGWRFIDYLRPGNYYGIEARQNRIDKAVTKVLPQYDLEDADFSVAVRDDFEFGVFDTQFEYALAQSVFTHVPWNDVRRCVNNIRAVLVPGGSFYATFLPAEKPFQTEPIGHEMASGDEKVTYFDRNPYHYHLQDFQILCDRLDDLGLTYHGDWGHPRNQEMLEFRRTEAESN